MIINAIILVYYHHEIIVTIHTGLFHIIRLKNVIFGLGILLCLTLGFNCIFRLINYAESSQLM